MRILEIVSGVGVNGAVVHCSLLSRQLAARGNQVTVLCRHNSWIAHQLDGVDNVTVVESDLRQWPLHELRRIARYAQDQGIEVSNTHMTRAHNFGVFLKRFSGIPCVTTAHSHKVQFHWWIADHLIAVSEITRRYHLRRNRIPESRIDTVHGFVDVGRFSGVSEESRIELKRSLGLSEHQLLIGAIGDFLPRKGQHYLVRALPKILAFDPDARLALAGSVRTPRYMELVRSEAERLNVSDKILWLGYRQDVPQLLTALDVYVLASLDEMFPVSVLEAMAAARPMVVTATGGTSECMPEAGAGLLIPAGDPEALAEGVLTFLRDPVKRAAYGARALETVCKHFTVEAQTPKIEAVFQKVINKSKR